MRKILVFLLCAAFFAVPVFAEEELIVDGNTESEIVSEEHPGTDEESPVQDELPTDSDTPLVGNDLLSDVRLEDLTIIAENLSLIDNTPEVEPEEPFLLFAAGNSYPLQSGYYIDCSTSPLGSMRIYLPKQYTDGYLAYTTNGNLFNLSNSAITTIGFTSNGTEYSIRWQTFSEPQYRLYTASGTTQYQNLSINSVSYSNVNILRDSTVPMIDNQVIFLIILCLLGVCVVCLFMRL